MLAQAGVVLTVVQVVLDPIPMITSVSTALAQCHRNWANGLYYGLRIYWRELDPTTLDAAVDFYDYSAWLWDEYTAGRQSLLWYCLQSFLF